MKVKPPNAPSAPSILIFRGGIIASVIEGAEQEAGTDSIGGRELFVG